MHGVRLTFGNLLSESNITSWYFLIVSVKSVEVPIELSEDCYCNLSVPIPNEQTLQCVENKVPLIDVDA